MRSKSKLQRAAMVALVAAALMAGAGQAGAVSRIPDEHMPSRVPVGRADHSVGALSARVWEMAQRIPEEIGVYARRIMVGAGGLARKS